MTGKPLTPFVLVVFGPQFAAMPFTKSNWACTPPIEEEGFFPYAKPFSLHDRTLDKGDQARPCFLHGE